MKGIVITINQIYELFLLSFSSDSLTNTVYPTCVVIESTVSAMLILSIRETSVC